MVSTALLGDLLHLSTYTEQEDNKNERVDGWHSNDYRVHAGEDYSS